jgi:hypothetical protein
MVPLMQLEDLEQSLAHKILKIIDKIHNTLIITNINECYFT